MTNEPEVAATPLKHLPADIRSLLALCPLLAVTETAIGGLALGFATLLSIAIVTCVMAAIRRFIARDVSFIVTVILVASVVSMLSLMMRAWLPSLTPALGVFLALVASNTALVTLVDSAQVRPFTSFLRPLRTSLGILVALLALGIAREIVGRGSLFTGAGRLFGDALARWEVAFFCLDMGFLLALLPPGAFIAAGLLLAARNLWRARTERSRTVASQTSQLPG